MLEESRAAALEVPLGESRRCGKVEGIRLCDFDMSGQFSKARKLGNAPIERGDSTKDIWIARFRRFAAHSRQVVVVDPYAVRRNNLDGILRLLRLLDGDAKRCRVTIYSSLRSNRGGASRVERTIKAEAAGLSGKGVASVGVRLFRDKDFKRYAHDRHLRFDNGVFRIGRGVRVFQHLHTKEATDITFVVLRRGRREEKEMNLERFGQMVHSLRVYL